MDDLTPRARVMILAGLLLGMMVTALDQNIISTAMPRIVANLGGLSLYSWTFTTYMLSSTSMMPIFGRLSDIYGRRRLFILGISIFMVGSWLSGVSQSMTELVIFRGIQGVGAGAIMPITIAAIADAFAPAERSKLQGIMTGVWGLASIIGPVLGGYISDTWSWRWIFYVNVPVGILAIAVTYFNMPDRREGVNRRIDYLGVVTLLAGLLPLLLALSLGGKDYPWGSPFIIALLAVAAVMLVFFPFLEARQPEPLLPLSLFRNSIFTVSAINVFTVGIGVFGALVFLPLFLQGVKGVSATDSGLLLTPMSITMVMSSAVGGQLMARTGYRNVAIVSMAVLLAGFFLLATMDASTSIQQAVLYVGVLGLAIGPVMPLFTIAVQNSVEHARMGVATSSIQFFRSMGGTIGVTLLGAFLANSLDARIRLQSPEAAAALGGGRGLADAQAILEPASGIAQLPPAALLFLRTALADSIQQAFIVAFGILVIAFIATLFLKEQPLRKRWDQPGTAPEAGETESRALAQRVGGAGPGGA